MVFIKRIRQRNLVAFGTQVINVILFMESGFQALPLFVLVLPVYGCLLYKNYTVRRGWGTLSFLFGWDPKKVPVPVYHHTILGL